MEQNLMTISQTVARAKKMGINCSAYSLKKWIDSGSIPSVKAGNRNLIYFPNFMKFITGSEEFEIKKAGEPV